jgi:hypothetical protein
MIGNFVNNPIHRESIQISEVEEFVFGLLKDIVSTSTNELLSVYTKVLPFEEESLDTLGRKDGTKCLLLFDFDKESPNNKNLLAGKKSDGKDVKATYNIVMLCKKGEVDGFVLLRAMEEVINGVIDNYNGDFDIDGNVVGQTKETPYRVTLQNGKKLSSNLWQNTCDPFPTTASTKKGEENYLTTFTNLNFIISTFL